MPNCSIMFRWSSCAVQFFGSGCCAEIGVATRANDRRAIRRSSMIPRSETGLFRSLVRSSYECPFRRASQEPATLTLRGIVQMRFLPIALIAVSSALGAQQHDAGIPQLRKQGSATQLVVDGKPFLILGGELGNSTASDVEGMRPMWAKLRAMNLNTVVAPVYWEFLEPREGQFDYTLVDSLIAQARAHEMRLVLLWFGSWKNSMS